MNYKFYGNQSNPVTPIDPTFAKVKDQRHLYDLLSECWSIETCAPRYRDEWSKANKTLGQCSITAFLVQDIFGGDVFGIPLPEGGYHCFNAVGDAVFDLTSEQFGDKVLDYQHVVEQVREEHFDDEEKYHRYLILKTSLLEKLNKHEK